MTNNAPPMNHRDLDFYEARIKSGHTVSGEDILWLIMRVRELEELTTQDVRSKLPYVDESFKQKQKEINYLKKANDAVHEKNKQLRFAFARRPGKGT